MLIHIVKPKLRQYHLLHVLLKHFISVFPLSILPMPGKDIGYFFSLQYFRSCISWNVFSSKRHGNYAGGTCNYWNLKFYQELIWTAKLKVLCTFSEYSNLVKCKILIWEFYYQAICGRDTQHSQIFSPVCLANLQTLEDVQECYVLQFMWQRLFMKKSSGFQLCLYFVFLHLKLVLLQILACNDILIHIIHFG